MKQQNETDKVLCEQDLARVTGGVDFVPVSGDRLPDFGKKPLHKMSPIQEEASTIASESAKTGKAVALGVGALVVSATGIGIGVGVGTK